MDRHLKVNSREIYIAAAIGCGTVLATALAVAFIIGATDGNQASFSNQLSGGLLLVAMGWPLIFLFATGLAIVLALPATLVWTCATHNLRQLGFSNQSSAVVAMAVTTIIAFCGLLAYNAEAISTYALLTYGLVPLVVSLSLSLWAFKEKNSALVATEK